MDALEELDWLLIDLRAWTGLPLRLVESGQPSGADLYFIDEGKGRAFSPHLLLHELKLFLLGVEAGLRLGGKK